VTSALFITFFSNTSSTDMQLWAPAHRGGSINRNRDYLKNQNRN
jgi:hypothetical protein